MNGEPEWLPRPVEIDAFQRAAHNEDELRQEDFARRFASLRAAVNGAPRRDPPRSVGSAHSEHSFKAY